jgi:putative transposase
MYARGMSTREITGHLHDLYGIDVSPDLISTVTDAVLDEVATWQQRPLDAVYPLVFFDAIRVKIRDEGMVRNKAIHIALGVRADGAKEVLGLWLEQNEGAKFWLRVMNELRNRGTEDILLAVVDGLKGFPEAITAVFPEAIVQTCWGGRPPIRHRCARMRSLQISSEGDRPWNRLPASEWTRQSTSFNYMA